MFKRIPQRHFFTNKSALPNKTDTVSTELMYTPNRGPNTFSTRLEVSKDGRLISNKLVHLLLDVIAKHLWNNI